MLLKIIEKYCQIVAHALFYCSTVYTVILFSLLLLIIDIVTVTVSSQ